MPAKKVNANTETIIWINVQTMEWIFSEYFSKLVFYAAGFLKNEETARDAVISAFLALWTQRDRIEFRSEKLLKGYLYAIVKHKSVDAVAATQKEQSLIEDLGYLEESVQHPEEMENAVILTEAIAFIREAIDNLSPQYHMVIQMLMEGKTHQEIARAMRITPSTVRGYKAKALNILKDKFSQYKGLSRVYL